MATGMSLGPDFNPGRVLLGDGGPGPYMPIGQQKGQSPFASLFPKQGGITASGTPGQLSVGPQFGTLAPEAVRATGSGPFDPAYRQNLATYAGGQFARPGGSLSFNPTGTDLFGSPTGAGNAPLPGMGQSLLDRALGGQPFNFQPPAPAATPDGGGTGMDAIRWWLQQQRDQGRGFGMML